MKKWDWKVKLDYQKRKNSIWVSDSYVMWHWKDGQDGQA